MNRPTKHWPSFAPRLLASGLLCASLLAPIPAAAEETVKIGLVIPLTGPFTSTGQEIQGAVRLYMKQHGDTVAGKQIELIVRDDAGVADTTKRLATELIVKDHVAVIAGFGLTPLALAVAPLATQAKIPQIIMGAATSSIPAASPFIVRTSFAVPQGVSIFGEWAAKNGIKTMVTMVSDYGPGIDTENWFKKSFEAAGGTVVAAIRVPLAAPDFAPFLQRAADAHPDGLFAFVPSGQGGVFARQFRERGLDKSGMKLFASGDVLDEQLIDPMGDVVLGLVSAYHYSDSHDSALNHAFTSEFKAANNGMRANMMGVGGYDGMALIYQALAKTGGDTNGEKLLAAMKGMAWESPRGPISIDPATRDIIQNEYLRRVERVNGGLANVEFQTFPNVKDPAKPTN